MRPFELGVGSFEPSTRAILTAREGFGNQAGVKEIATYSQFTLSNRKHLFLNRVLGTKQMGICSSDGTNTQPNSGPEHDHWGEI